MNAATTDRAWDGRVANVAQLSQVLRELHPTGPDGGPLAVAAVLNLVVVADSAGARDAERVIEALADHQPSRAIVVVRDPSGDGIDAHIEARAQLMGGARAASRVELLHLDLHGAAAEGAASAVHALLRPDLPVFVWWPSTPDSTDPVFRALVQRADRLILEADHGNGAAALEALSRTVSDRGPAVTDLAWASLTPWRQLLNQLITREHLEGMRDGASITIIHTAATPSLTALLLAGWLRDSVGPSVQIAFRSESRAGDPSICEIDLVARGGRRLELSRVSGRAAASVVSHTAAGLTHEHMMPLPEPTRAQLLAGELDLQRRDAPFERALRNAQWLAVR
jgi:glucose-6-phosphate dehydrogenase assembly protein OpcA